MPPIHILPPNLADKIAAGEVVERPASVVKELMENALDSGATHIRLDVSKKPSDALTVSDNGCGMSLEEACLSIQRHATSKILEEADLFSIRTLGFRGEALPSIAAVSKMAMESKAKEGGSEGVTLIIEGGKLLEARPAGVPDGTRIIVKEIFYNTPARLKFLKSDGVELGHVEDTFIRLALSRLDCAFDYSAGGVLKISCAAGGDPLARLHACLGKDFVADAVAFEERHPELSLKGWIVHPRQTGSSANDIHFYLNGRFLRDRMLQHALTAGFSDFLMKGRYPKALLYLQMDPREVDVNVHPAKREVRFVKPQIIHEFVAKAVKKVLQKKIYAVDEGGLEKQAGLPDDEGPAYFSGRPEKLPYPSAILSSYPGCENRLREIPHHPESRPDISKPISFKDIKIIGSFYDTYILCEAVGGKLILIDQHAAHERIGFEKLKKNLGGKNAAQRLLVPITWETNARQAGFLQTYLGDLREAGIEIEPFGQNTFVIKAVPALLQEAKMAPLLDAIVRELEEVGASRAMGNAMDLVLKTMACHTMVRAKDKLSLEEMRHLLIEMDEYHATHCPHGRPTAVELTLGEIEKWFKRT
ncbi:MAG: DNA mismatch repair endonuclease MutL [Deltaproteobacteria bacterium]|nr:DNA mismatch repair endonuclease MutL [Deltaproteobacteria bacterium]